MYYRRLLKTGFRGEKRDIILKPTTIFVPVFLLNKPAKQSLWVYYWTISLNSGFH